MQPRELIAKWSARRDAYELGGARVDGAPLCDEMVRDIQQLDASVDDELLSIADAALRSGFTATHLRRLISSGKLMAHGSGRARVVRLGDLPRKPSAVAPIAPPLHLLGAKAEQVVRDSAGVSNGTPR